MQPLAAETHSEAVAEALALMKQHRSAVIAHVFLDDERVASVLASSPTPETHVPQAFQGELLKDLCSFGPERTETFAA
jgi:hypothetical protein